MSNKPTFQPGQLVRLKWQPDSLGAVLSANESGPGLSSNNRQNGQLVRLVKGGSHNGTYFVTNAIVCHRSDANRKKAVEHSDS